ncbi:MAG: hypothetical protein AAF671_03155 [Pseudomonadota bacterium]
MRTSAITQNDSSPRSAQVKTVASTSPRMSISMRGMQESMRGMQKSMRGMQRKTAAVLVAVCSISLGNALASEPAQAEITQDCILEGTIDLRAAKRLSQPTYVKFRSAKRGTEAACAMSRKSQSRRVKFISNPDPRDIQHVSHGSTVRYRYVEHDYKQGQWELLEIVENTSI